MNTEQQIKDEIEAMNVTLAKFMGWTLRELPKSSYADAMTIWYSPSKSPINNLTYGFPSSQLPFNDQWGQIMPVVEKIETVDLELYGRMTVAQSHNHCTVFSQSFSDWQSDLRNKKETNSGNTYFGDHYGKDKKEATFIACVAFVGWLEKGIESGELKYKTT